MQCALVVRQYKLCNCQLLFRRLYGKKYSNMLNLPTTKFPLSMKNGLALQREKQIQKTCEFGSLYKWQQNQQREKEFVLHDGPPYANGDTHVGHALNKIMKDITNRYKLLCGHKIHYVPGWDCHGMPIEQKALAGIRADHRTLEPMEIRQRARQFAEKNIKKQKASFEEWGIMADWKNNCYFTFDKDYESDQLEVFYELYEKGFVYQDYMPVFWSPSSGTALAEAELEYNDQHVSTAVYVKMPLKDVAPNLQQHLENSKAYAVIWTTTPWTLPANQAICYANNIRYSLVKAKGCDEVYLVGAEFGVETLPKLLNKEVDVLTTVTGSDLSGTTYTHPLWREKTLPMLNAAHVTPEKGTGLVHTAPAHGSEDFAVAKKEGLSMECYVDESGFYSEAMGPDLCGKSVLDEGNKTVLELMKNSIIHQSSFTHSYPYDWRSTQPVIWRACKQWFVNTEQLGDKAIGCLNTVNIFPKGSASSMLAQLVSRTYWCISRQRVWGVPIPVFYKEDTGEVLLNRGSIEHVKSLVRKHGTDCWWELSVDELLPREIKEQSGFSANDKFNPGNDVLDIWFDSGSSWANVLKDSNKSCDLYLEGLDQFGGWFQSSLLTSVATRGEAPYKALVVHGFVTDEEGRKMSKSLGNVVSPVSVIHGDKSNKAEPSYGIDVLRLWVAQSGLDTVVNIGPNVLQRFHEWMFKTRKSVRYLIGNLFDFDPAQNTVAYPDLLPQDKYMLHLLHQFLCEVKGAYESYNYSVVIQLSERFINAKISSFYSTMLKDRLYCSCAESLQRRSGQTVQFFILDAIVKCLAPITPHFSEEIYQYHPFKGSVFKSSWLKPDEVWQNKAWNDVFESAITIRDALYQNILTESPVSYNIVICAQPQLFNTLKKLQDDALTSSHSPLCELLRCSSVTLLSRIPPVIPEDSQPVDGLCKVSLEDGTEKESKFLLLILPAEDFICERCRRYTAKRYNEPCDYCAEVMAQGWG